jgi:hypothetical protein
MSADARGTQHGTSATMPRPRAPRDLRRFDRILAAVLMPIGPAAIAVLRFVIPGEPVGESIAADPGGQRLADAMSTIAVFTLVPGAYAALRLLRRHRPMLTLWTGALLVPAYLALTAGSMLGAADLTAIELGTPPNEVTARSEALLATPTIAAMLLLFVVGHITGTVLLGITACIARVIPVWAGVLLAISQPLHLTAVIIENRPLDLAAWGLTAVGMAFLAWRVLHTPDDEWDLPPNRPA